MVSYRDPGVCIIIRKTDPEPAFEHGLISRLMEHDSPPQWRGESRALLGDTSMVCTKKGRPLSPPVTDTVPTVMPVFNAC
jgi:hypothetical protein